jgi:hypothetical protein
MSYKFDDNFAFNSLMKWLCKIFYFYIVPISQNVSIRWEMNFYDENTFYRKGLSEQNEFSQNTSLAPIYRPPKSKVFFRPIFR